MGQAWGVVTPSMRRQCAIDTTSAPGGFEGEGGRRSKGGGWVGTNRYPRFNCFFLLPTDFQILRATKGFGGTDATKEPSKSIRQEPGGRASRSSKGGGRPRATKGAPIRTSGDENTNYGTGDRFTLGLGTRPSFAGIAQGCDDPPEDRITGLRPWPHDAATQRRPDRAHDDDR